MEKVIIVESPSKSHTIGEILKSFPDSYTVLSSKGHVSDLATTGKDGLGIDIANNFRPSYVIMPEKKKLVDDLKKACKGKMVYLATDPDREGEAIAYHLASILGLSFDENNRIEFNEITKDGVNQGIATPHKIDMKMVHSQETRRMIDRILGFKLSNLMRKKLQSRSAGRVQSVALLLICNLEKEILSFIPITYYMMEADFGTFKLTLQEINGKKINDNNRILDRKILEDLKASLKAFKVSNIQTKTVSRSSYPTFTTSTMEQTASNRLGFPAAKTMSIAQKLYEGKKIGDEVVGLITYMRTDSTRLATSFVQQVKDFIVKKYGPKYVGAGTKIKNQKGMQDGHEGIRPTSILRTPESVKAYLSDEEYKLYNLIYNRTLASLMSNASFSQTKIDFENTNSLWSTTGRVMLFDGFLKIEEKEEDDKNSLIPEFVIGEEYNPFDVQILEKMTQPKSRYTEASIIKDMEELGIGRPSTYAQTIDTLKKSNYIKIEKKSIIPTEQGVITTDKLQEYFKDLINVKYTANMELDLDKIASGEMDELEELNEFYNHFIPLYDNAKNNMDSLYPIETDEICPNCGNKLVIRLGRFGEFTACSNYPSCKYIKQEEKEDSNKSVDTGILCPICKSHNLFKRVASRGKNKGNIFYSCEDFRKCKATYNDMPTNELCPNCNSMMLKDKDGNLYCSNNCLNKDDEIKEENVLCPVCNKGTLIKRTASRGKNKGNVFFGCSNFPKCKTIISIEDYNKLLNK